MSKSAIANTSDWRSVYPFASCWLPSVNGRMHYLDEGPGTRSESDSVLLFVHGNPTWSFHWRRLIEALRTQYRCIAPDHVGCGLSDKPQRLLSLGDHISNLRRLIERLDLQRVTLIAQDWGGAIGLGTMLEMPERLDRIVLFNTGAFPPRYIPWRIRACRVPILGRLAVQGANAFSLAALRMTLARRRRLEPEVEAGYLAPYDSWAHRRAVYGFVRDIPSTTSHRGEVYSTNQSTTHGDAATILAAIERKLPTLADRPGCLVWGMRDWCFRPDCLDRFVEAWPQAEVHRLADVGHWVVEDAPDDSREIVSSFLDSTRKRFPASHQAARQESSDASSRIS